MEGDDAKVNLWLSFRDGHTVGAGDQWKLLHWSDLERVHGRRIHVSVVSTDLSNAWHVHPTDARSSDTMFAVVLRLPPHHAGDTSALKLRLHVSFGVLADNPGVSMCVSEDSVHIDPAPGGQQLVVEGQVLHDPRPSYLYIPTKLCAGLAGDGRRAGQQGYGAVGRQGYGACYGR